MCGIHCHVRHVAKSETIPQLEAAILSPALAKLLSNRGPDSLRTLSIYEAKLDTALAFTSSVLSLRGNLITRQPLVAQGDTLDPAYVLCWNGEAWRFQGQEFALDQNDGEVIFEKLTHCQGNVPQVITQIEGPFAFVFYDRLRQKLWFGRDWLGRRSLLISKTIAQDDSNITLCSIADTSNAQVWDEVEANGIYLINLDSRTNSTLPDIELIPFLPKTNSNPSPLSLVTMITSINVQALIVNDLDTANSTTKQVYTS